MSARHHARDAKRLVIKVGSAILAGPSGIRGRLVSDLARQVAALRSEGRQVVIVSSGAIAAGSRELGWDHTGRTIPEKQAAAAVDQSFLGAEEKPEPGAGDVAELREVDLAGLRDPVENRPRAIDL